jgi:hypothetical protein
MDKPAEYIVIQRVLCDALQKDETDIKEGYVPTCKVQFDPKHPL